MEVGMIGLGKMGANLARRLQQGGHHSVVYDVDRTAVEAMRGEGFCAANNLAELVEQLPAPRVLWLMVPHGEVTERSISELAPLLSRGDVIIDGGNSYFKDDVRRARDLKAMGIDYLDVGTSGGVAGLARGYCLMIGGDKAAYARVEPLFATLAPGAGSLPKTPGREGCEATAEEGYLYCGPAGAGHFVKMIHNGIEYGMMQAIAEGFDILRCADGENIPEERRYQLPLADIAEVWRRGSVITSWLLDLTAESLAENPDLSNFSGVVQDSGEGRWTVEAAIEEAVPAEVLTAALYTRFRSRQEHTFAEKVLSAMRSKFGGHKELPSRGKER